MKYPLFSELPFVPGTNERHSWDAFGRDDEFGCLNFLDPRCVAEAAKLVRTGEIVNLNLPLDEPSPSFWSSRKPLEHAVHVSKAGRDDHLDRFYLQGSTQWDGLRHARYKQHGYFGGRQEEDLDNSNTLGIDRWAERGIVGRGILIDAARYFQGDKRYKVDERFPITNVIIEDVARAQKVTFKTGDILLIRTGWLGWYQGLPMQERERLAERFRIERSTLRMPGLSPSMATTEWLWNTRISCIAADNPTLETLHYMPAEGWAHQRILPLLGLPFGELWELDKLSKTCEAAGRYEFMVFSAPLNLPRGVGSPANAYAVF